MRYCIWYAICDLFNKRILTIVTIVMFATSFVVIEKSGLFYLTYNYNRIQAKDVITTSFDQTYKVNISKYSTGFCSENDRDNIIDFLNEIDSLECIEISGLYFESSGDVEHPILFISKKLLNMCGIVDDKYADFSCLAGENTGYKDGDTFKIHDDMPDYVFTVSGNTKKNKKFIASSYLDSSGKILELDDYIIISMESLLEIEPWYIVNGLNNIYFVAKEGYSKKYIINEIEMVAHDCDIDLYGVKTLNEAFDEFSKYAMENVGVNYLIPLALVACSIITMLMGSSYSIKLNKKDYGIMLANGMTHMDISLISVIAVEMKIIIAFVMASVYVYVNSNIIDENGIVMFKRLFPAYILFLLIISLIVIGITATMVNLENTKSKIEENK